MNLNDRRFDVMAIYRNIQLSFWTDNKVLDEFTPEDKYFYLYLLTNPHTNICGCYEISYKSMVDDTGYNKDTCIRLLERFENVHNVIRFNSETKEVLILNWHKYNWSKSPKTLNGVESVVKHIKCAEFRDYLYKVMNCIANDEKPPEYDDKCISEPCVVDIPDNDNELEVVKNVVDYLNAKCGTRYSYKTASTKKHIRARLKDGFTESDMLEVIDKKLAEWKGTQWEQYLRPETLFGAKFESYLNQKINTNESSMNDSYAMMNEWANGE